MSRPRRTRTSSATTRCGELGVNRVSFCFEIFDPCVFKDVCPGKDRQYGSAPYEAVRYCASLGKKGPRDEPWVTNGEIIVGLGAARVLDQGDRLDLDHLGGRDPDRVRVPAARGHRLLDVPPPETAPLRAGVPPATRRAWSGGCRSASAPNIHVSLVLLPTSAAARRFPLQTLKLKLMSHAAKAMVARNVRKAARTAAATA